MALWTDVIDPATLTGYARASQEDYERRKGSLSAFLPNQKVDDVVVRMMPSDTGLVQAASYRAFDAEPEFGASEAGRRVNVELAPVSQKLALSEYDRMRNRNASDDAMLQAVQRTTERAVAAVSDAVEYMRGLVIATGKATVDYGRGGIAVDDFGRAPEMDVTAAVAWDQTDAKPLDDLVAYLDAYAAMNGSTPGALLMSRKVLMNLAKNPALATTLVGGANRPATQDDLAALLGSYGIPEIRVVDRKVRRYNRENGKVETVSVLPDDSVFLLPQASEFSELGATFWAPTLGATEMGYGIAEADRAGITAGVYRNELPPHIAEVFADAVALPVLANPNLAMRATVLAPTEDPAPAEPTV